MTNNKNLFTPAIDVLSLNCLCVAPTLACLLCVPLSLLVHPSLTCRSIACYSLHRLLVTPSLVTPSLVNVPYRCFHCFNYSNLLFPLHRADFTVLICCLHHQIWSFQIIHPYCKSWRWLVVLLLSRTTLAYIQHLLISRSLFIYCFALQLFVACNAINVHAPIVLLMFSSFISNICASIS